VPSASERDGREVQPVLRTRIARPGNDPFRLREVKGWLKFFVAMKLYVAPVLFVSGQTISWFTSSEFALGHPRIILLWLMQTAVQGLLTLKWIQISLHLWNFHVGVVQEAKTWLKIELGWTIVGTVLNVLFFSGVHSSAYAAYPIAGSVGGGVLYFGIWYSYFCVSKRVRATYPDWSR
jgi:hypothetical protein